MCNDGAAGGSEQDGDCFRTEGLLLFAAPAVVESVVDFFEVSQSLWWNVVDDDCRCVMWQGSDQDDLMFEDDAVRIAA